MASAIDLLVQDMTDEQRQALGHSKRGKGGTGHSQRDGRSPYDRANAVDTSELVDALGLSRPNDAKPHLVICPGCGADTGCEIQKGGGLLCYHDSCRDRGQNGWRSNVDLVAEVKQIRPPEAVNWLGERFGFKGIVAREDREPDEDSPEAQAAELERPEGAPDVEAEYLGPEPGEARPVISWLDGPALAEPLAPTPWRIRGLHIAPGRPTMVAAYGASGKTMSMQSALLSYAAGLSVWGQFPTGPGGIVRHLDFEQGRHATVKRYQRLALGIGVDLAELGERIGLAPLPTMYLNDPTAEHSWCSAIEGADIVLIDSLRAACPGTDENDSAIRIHLDTLTRLSEVTGAAFIIIHHAGKPREGHDDKRTIARGSSALFDACGGVFVMVGAKGDPKLVSQQKTPADAEGAALEDFYLAIEDVTEGTNPTAGIKVSYQTREQVCPPAAPGSKFEALKAKVVEVVVAEAGLCSRNAICSRVEGGRKDQKLQAIGELLGEGRLAQVGEVFRVSE